MSQSHSLPTNLPGRWLAWTIFALIAIYGLLALDVSRTLVATFVDEERRQTMISEFHQGQGPASAQYDPGQRLDEGGLFFAIQSDATSVAYTYGPESNYAQLIEYISLPRLNHALLTVHTATGGLALILMLVLLVPGSRRRLFHHHRRLGRTTATITAISMLCSAGYLITTPEEKVFADRAFYIGLWILAVLVSASLIVAILAIRQGHRARHQAFMHLVFAALLTAPLLRLDWMLIALFNPDSTWTQNHFLAEIILLPQCLLLGYLFYLWARHLNPLAAGAAPWSPTPRPAGLPPRLVAPLALVATLLSLFYLDLEYLTALAGPVISHPEQHAAAVRAAAAAAATSAPLLFASQKLLMVATALFAIALLAWQALRGRAVLDTPGSLRWLLSATVLVSGVLALLLAPSLGAPSHELRSAGGYLFIYGLIALALVTLKLWAAINGDPEIEREVHWLSLGLALAPAQFSLSWLLETLLGSPPLDAYALGAGNAALGLIAPLVWIFWSQQATNRRVY